MSKTEKKVPEKKAAAAKPQAKETPVKTPVKKTPAKPAAKKVVGKKPAAAKAVERVNVPRIDLEKLVAATTQLMKDSPPRPTDAVEAKGQSYRRLNDEVVSTGPREVKEIPTALQLRKEREVPKPKAAESGTVTAKSIFGKVSGQKSERSQGNPGFKFNYR